MERFACETVVISGEGAMAALAELPGKRLLVVTDPLSVPVGLVERVRGIVRPETMTCFEGVTPEAAMGQVVEGVRQLRQFKPDLVVAVGDSYVMDSAKSMVCFSRHSCQLAAVPTLAGSGAEVTARVSLLHERRRHTLQDRAMRPDMAILDSSLMKAATAASVAEGGFEILANSLEGYSGKNPGVMAGFHAREAFVAGWAALPAACAGNPAARGRLQTAAAMAGIAYDRTGLGLCHAMVGSLGSVFHLAPGKLCGILLPAVVECNCHAAGMRYAELARAAGMGGSSESIGVRNLRAGLIRLRRELGLPATLAQAGINPRWVWNNAQGIVELTLEDPECRNNPVTVDDFLIRRILEKVAGRY